MKLDASSEDCAHAATTVRREQLDAKWREFEQGRPEHAVDYEYWGRLLEAVNQLGPDERAVLLLQAERLARGRRDYGELVLETDTRNFCREAAEEAMDQCQYLAMLLLAWSQREGGR